MPINRIKKKKISDKKIDFLIRKSGTENLIRIMVQSPKKSYVEDSIGEMVEIIKKIDE